HVARRQGGRMRFSIDPWDPAYGTSGETEMPASDAPVVVDVELPAREWRPLRPAPGTAGPGTVVFGDCVRRIHARTWGQAAPGHTEPGIFASYAAGALR